LISLTCMVSNSTTLLSRFIFYGVDLEGAKFDNDLITYVDIQKLCKNATLPKESRTNLACKETPPK